MVKGITGIQYNQFGIIQVLQRSPILQTSNWSGTFFVVSYSKPALIRSKTFRSVLHTYQCAHTCNVSIQFLTDNSMKRKMNFLEWFPHQDVSLLFSIKAIFSFYKAKIVTNILQWSMIIHHSEKKKISLKLHKWRNTPINLWPSNYFLSWHNHLFFLAFFNHLLSFVVIQFSRLV